MQVFPVHTGDTVRQNHDPVIEVEGSERCIEYAGVRVDAHQAYGANVKALEQDVKISAHKAVEALLVVDDVIAFVEELRDDLGPR